MAGVETTEQTGTRVDGPRTAGEGREVLPPVSNNPEATPETDQGAAEFVVNAAGEVLEAGLGATTTTGEIVAERANIEDFITPRETYDNMDPNIKAKLEKRIPNSPVLLSYPSDINSTTSDTELVHSVVFNILARSNSRVAQIRQNQGLTREVDISEQNRTTGENAEQYLASLGAVAGAATAYTRIRKANAQARSIGGAALGALGAGLQGAFVAGAGAIAGKIAAENNTVVDIQTAIELYVTQPPIAEYEAMWEQKELGALGGILARGDTANFSKEGFLTGASGLGELGIRGVIGAAASIPDALGISGDLAAGIQATSKKVTNPYKEQLFKSMGFRKFAFSHKFVPRNNTELQTVLNIIQQFKYHMHPENDRSNLFLEYPSEFNIEYRYKGQRNTYVSRISTCALTGMKVTYGGQDAFTSFVDTRGAPSEFQMDLVFEELETLTNDRIGLDYTDSL